MILVGPRQVIVLFCCSFHLFLPIQWLTIIARICTQINFLLPGTPNNGGAWTSCSIVYGNEFSSRLSVRSILRLRAATLTALSEDTATDTAVIFRLARRLLHLSRYRGSKNEGKGPGLGVYPGAVTAEAISHIHGSRHMNNTEGTPYPQYILWVENSLVTLAIMKDENHALHNLSGLNS